MIVRGLSALSICFLLCGCVERISADDNAGETHANADETHAWHSISYPDLRCNFGNGTASASISVADQPDVKGLRFALGFWWPKVDESEEGFAPPDGSNIRLRLHYADGSVVTPRHSDFTEPFARSSHMGRNFHGRFLCVFPWGNNEMQEAWLEVTFPERSYWLEIPYGFTRDPSSANLPTSEAGPPKLAPAMETLPENAQIVNWKDVYYEIGEVTNDYRVSLLHSNPFDAHSRIFLARGVDGPKWDLHSPRTSVSIHQESGLTLDGWAKGIRLSESDSNRTDDFDFIRNGGDDEIRDWGTIVVTVGDREWQTIMPSSLFRYVHGIADPHHEATLR